MSVLYGKTPLPPSVGKTPEGGWIIRTTHTHTHTHTHARTHACTERGNDFFFYFFFDYYFLFIFLYSRFLFVLRFIHISVYMSIPISQFITRGNDFYSAVNDRIQVS